ncbi:FtsK/SpoIIIE domain-containing protein [Ruminococcus sp.]|uniref:FtsK/SpoIIIE domain-containing protein n=1 Tax=Ruminococcus sp. TaxID=41978 RepID=UPI002C9D4212|nr:FtsK/SpoIIIE domain-containing protein [Ruminococcus sp.]HNZ99226.1 FtsK/SpoIIIE domain-containing protein [Ruminococcus sp.]
MSRKKIVCTLGKFDIPIIQLQPDFNVDLLDSNIMAFGASMSGKTTFLKTLVNILHKRMNEKEERIFILDFGGALSDYRDMPLVSAYFDNSNEEYVKRVFKIMDNILKENIKLLGGRNYREVAECQPVHTTFIIDNLNAFTEESRYIAYQEKLAKLCRDGLSKGITVVVTAGDTKGLNSYMASFRQKIAFEMPADKYLDIFNDKAGSVGNNPGHGFANVTVKPEGITGTFKMNLPYEVQCFKAQTSADPDGKNVTFAQGMAKKYDFDSEAGEYRRHVRRYLTFPKELTREEYEKLAQQPENDAERLCPVSVGLDYVDFCPVTIDLARTNTLAIYGKKEFGKTNLLSLLLEGLVQQAEELRMVFFDDGRNQLKFLYDKYSSECDCVLINGFEKRDLPMKDGTVITGRKLSPIQQFYLYLNENYIELDKRFLAGIYGVSDALRKEYENIPDCTAEETPFTVFVIQSKLVYLNTPEGKRFINSILPQLTAVAEERGFLFIFSDVQKISDGEQNSFFNNNISYAFLLDNIAEFAGERGQKTVFGNMDVKTLKEDYARCELGDGYSYDIEADRLVKLKFIKHGKDD